MSLAVTVAADYECLCNYNVETPVSSIADNHGQAIGHMYEFDCKPTYPTYKPDGWLAIQFEGKVCYFYYMSLSLMLTNFFYFRPGYLNF